MEATSATICRSYTFEAAHFLPDLPPTHKCRRMHGHSYTVEIRIAGELDMSGMVRSMEFGAMDLVLESILTTVDHHCWNDKMKQPTVESIAAWFLMMVELHLKVPMTVRVYEGPRSWAEVSSA